MSFPTTSVIETFTHANVTPYTNFSDMIGNGGTLSVTSNQATGGAAGLSQVYYNVASYGNDMEAYITVAALPTNANATILWVRVASPGSYPGITGYGVKWVYNSGGTDTWTLRKLDSGGTDTQIASGSQDVAVNDKIGISVVGTTITGWYYNGSWATPTGLTATDATLATGSRIGISLNNDTTRLDDLGGGTYVAPAAGAGNQNLLLTGVG